MSNHFQQRMSWLPQRWRTQRNAIRHANCKIQWVIKTLNASCTSPEVCLLECLFYPHQFRFFGLGVDCHMHLKGCGLPISLWNIDTFRWKTESRKAKGEKNRSTMLLYPYLSLIRNHFLDDCFRVVKELEATTMKMLVDLTPSYHISLTKKVWRKEIQ